MKQGEDILSRQRRLLSTISMKCVPVAPRYLEFRLEGQKCAFKLPKVPDLAEYVKKRQKLFYCFGDPSNFSTIFAFLITLPIHQFQFNFGQVLSLVL